MTHPSEIGTISYSISFLDDPESNGSYPTYTYYYDGRFVDALLEVAKADPKEVFPNPDYEGKAHFVAFVDGMVIRNEIIDYDKGETDEER